MDGFIVQAAALGWCAVCFFMAGARSKRIPLTWRSMRDIVLGALIVVAVFGLATDLRGCSTSRTTTPDCAAGSDADC